MSVYRHHGKIVFECDDCGDQFESDTRDFDDAWQDAKDEGWLAYKDDKFGWEHFCPECQHG